jgi:hypothetical protein
LAHGQGAIEKPIDKGALLNWSKSTGTITFQGPKTAAKDRKAAFLNVTEVSKKEPTVGEICSPAT